jgi:predicted acetyltransferase
MNPTIEKVMRGEVVVKTIDTGWKVNSIGTDFLDWMRENYKDQENVTWQLWYYSGTMAIIEIADEKIMTMVNLRW